MGRRYRRGPAVGSPGSATEEREICREVDVGRQVGILDHLGGEGEPTSLLEVPVERAPPVGEPETRRRGDGDDVRPLEDTVGRDPHHRLIPVVLAGGCEALEVPRSREVCVCDDDDVGALRAEAGDAGPDGSREAEAGSPDHAGTERLGEGGDLVVVADHRHRQGTGSADDPCGELPGEAPPFFGGQHPGQAELRVSERLHRHEQRSHRSQATGGAVAWPGGAAPAARARTLTGRRAVGFLRSRRATRPLGEASLDPPLPPAAAPAARNLLHSVAGK